VYKIKGNLIMMTKVKTAVLIMVAVNIMWCSGVFAGQAWLCSIASALSVDEDGTVGPPNLDGLERPTFFRVDSGKMELTLLAPESRSGEVTKIDNVKEGKGLWIFSGVENERVWNLIISQKGHVTLSISHDGVVWSVFGHALPEDDHIAGEAKN